MSTVHTLVDLAKALNIKPEGLPSLIINKDYKVGLAFGEFNVYHKGKLVERLEPTKIVDYLRKFL